MQHSYWKEERKDGQEGREEAWTLEPSGEGHLGFRGLPHPFFNREPFLRLAIRFASLTDSESKEAPGCYRLSKFHIYALVYCIGVFLSGLLHSV